MTRRRSSAHAAAPAFYVPGQYQPEQSVGVLMRRVLASLVTQADARLAAHELTFVQWLPLHKLAAREGDTPAALARELNFDPGAMTRALDRLEAKGLLARERSQADRRVVHLRLTAEGRKVAKRVPPVLAEVLNGHLQGFSEAEWQQLVSLLNRMLANGEALQPPAPPGAAR